MTAPNTISLDGHYKHEEALCAAAITPGHLVEVYNASGTLKVRKHSTIKGAAAKAVAVEDALQGGLIDDAYASGDLVPYHIHEPGSRAYVFLAPPTNYVVGDKLESAGNGTLAKAGTDSSGADLEVLAIVEEALDLSGTGDVATRTVVRFV